MHLEVLIENQKKLLPLLKCFKKDYYLVGGTAIALQIGHRFSVDFDLFTYGDIKRRSIRNTIERLGFKIEHMAYEDYEQFHCRINGVSLTFFKHYYKIPAEVGLADAIKMPSLLDLAAMKADALGGRGKWKDYVDLYFIIKNYYSVDDIIKRCIELFGCVFNDKLFKEQLSYFDDLKLFTQEKVEYMKGFEVSDEEIRNFLTQKAVEKI